MNTELQTKALSWFDGLPVEMREDLLHAAGRSYFTFEELIDQYVIWLECKVLIYEERAINDRNNRNQ